ncbi:MAG: bile acid:sodium symporter [Akkermansia sp.]|nr:bile acid:sodium symporter [Akkermansia sp.]
MGVVRKILRYFDVFTTGILIALVLGIIVPCHGIGAAIFDWLTNAAIVLLFFLYGVKLSRKSVVEGLLNWRLQSMVFAFTFVFFPVVIPLLRPLFEPLVGAALYMGLVYVACLPSTVQSSIAFTSVAGGNVPAAVCSASVSSLLGVFLTPFLVSLLFATDGSGAQVGLDTVLKICYQILLPFIAGQLSQPLLRKWVLGHKTLIGWNDKSTIWLVVYTAFSNATSGGYWDKLQASQLAGLVVVCGLILCLTFIITWYSSRLLGFNREDSITIVFCGSKKSLAVGAPMMLAIFGTLDNNLLLPLMVFHQVQLMLCAHLARIWQRGSSADTGGY